MSVYDTLPGCSLDIIETKFSFLHKNIVLFLQKRLRQMANCTRLFELLQLHSDNFIILATKL